MRKSIYSPDYRLLIVLMRRAREERGLTQESVAMHLGITASQLSKWERFERRVDASELRSYCNAIGVPIGQLIRDWERELASE
ncbi:MAG: helix-turn-helix domain-containing protein [Fimbriimonadaceae bacterium]|nr:helix-turn-helix domain-containing protein [Fimbriimonadaceae bacterium]